VALGKSGVGGSLIVSQLCGFRCQSMAPLLVFLVAPED
jgi:hypothetical protein